MQTITQISENKKNKNRVSIFVNDEFVLSCDKELIYTKSLKKGQSVDVSTLRELAIEDDYLRARDTSFRFLEKTMKTEKQVRDRLLEKEFEPSTIDRVIVLLEEYNLLDDRHYVELFLKEKLRSRGIKKVTYELYNKGINKEMLEEILEDFDTGSLEKESCQKLAEKKFSEIKKKEEDRYKQKSKLYAFLAGKGYGYEMINAVIRQVMDETSEE